MSTAFLEIGKLVLGQGYSIRLIADGAETATGTLPETWTLNPTLPGHPTPVVTPLSLWRFVSNTPSSPDLVRVGKFLYDMLAATPAGAAWDALRAAGPQRTILDIRDPGLRLVPWELMTTGFVPLFNDTTSPISRGRVAAPAPAPFQPVWPVRALVVVGSKEGDSRVNAEDEVANVRREVRRFGRPVELNVLWWPTKSQLAAEIAKFRPHVFHFIGHGDLLVGAPVLLLSDRAGLNAQEVGVVELRTMIDPVIAPAPPTLRVAVINACGSAAPGPAADPAVLALTEAFVDARVPAVFGMQADLRADAATAMTAPLYKALIDNDPALLIDAAMAKVRQDVLIAIGATFRDWALPLLYLSAPPQDVLPLRPISPALLSQIAGTPQFIKIQRFVDRESARHALCFALNPITPAAAAPPRPTILVVRGESEVGKSALISYCLEGCKLREWTVGFVDMRADSTGDLLTLLRRIRDGRDDRTAPLEHSRLDPAAFHHFNNQVNNLSELQAKRTVAPPVGPVPDNMNPWPGHDYAPVEQILDTFCRALEAAAAAAGGGPLILAFDHLKVDPGHFRSFLVPFFLLPIARGDYPNLRVIMAISDEAGRDYDLAKIDGHYTSVPVDRIPAADWKRYALEFFQYGQQYPVPPSVIGVIEAFAKSETIRNGWKPADLGTLAQLLKS